MSDIQESKDKNFGITEILLILITIALFSFIIFFSLNNRNQVSDTYNLNREIGVNKILSAIEVYSINNHGMFPPSIPTIPGNFIIGNVNSSGIGAGFNINTKKEGIPNCIQAGAKSNICLSVSKQSIFYSQIKEYLKGNFPQGSFYVAKNVYGNEVVVFANNLGTGKSVDSKGLAVAFLTYKQWCWQKNTTNINYYVYKQRRWDKKWKK